MFLQASSVRPLHLGHMWGHRLTCSSAYESVSEMVPLSAETSANEYRMCVNGVGLMSVGSAEKVQ